MKYVDGKLRIVVEIYNTIFMDINAYSDNFMYNCGMASEIESDAKTIDITSVAGDSDNLSQPEETKAGTTVSATSTASQTTAITTTTTTTTTATTTPQQPQQLPQPRQLQQHQKHRQHRPLQDLPPHRRTRQKMLLSE